MDDSMIVANQEVIKLGYTKYKQIYTNFTNNQVED